MLFASYTTFDFVEIVENALFFAILFTFAYFILGISTLILISFSKKLLFLTFIATGSGGVALLIYFAKYTLSNDSIISDLLVFTFYVFWNSGSPFSYFIFKLAVKFLLPIIFKLTILFFKFLRLPLLGSPVVMWMLVIGSITATVKIIRIFYRGKSILTATSNKYRGAFRWRRFFTL